MRIVQMMPVSWILQNVTRSVDVHGSEESLWADMIRNKVYSGSILMLMNIVLSQGCFDDPVCITRYYSTDKHWTMGNGHHRLTTAILCGLDEIPVCLDFDGDYMNEDITDEHDDPDNFDYDDDFTNWLVGTLDFSPL